MPRRGWSTTGSLRRASSTGNNPRSRGCTPSRFPRPHHHPSSSHRVSEALSALGGPRPRPGATRPRPVATLLRPRRQVGTSAEVAAAREAAGEEATAGSSATGASVDGAAGGTDATMIRAPTSRGPWWRIRGRTWGRGPTSRRWILRGRRRRIIKQDHQAGPGWIRSDIGCSIPWTRDALQRVTWKLARRGGTCTMASSETRVDCRLLFTKTPGLLRACVFLYRLIRLRIPPGTPRISIRTMPTTMLTSATLTSGCISAASLSSSGRTARVGLAISSRAIRGERVKGASPARLVVRAAAEDDVFKVRSIPSSAR